MVFTSPTKKSSAPSWQTLVNKRNQQLASPPVRKDQPNRRSSVEEVDPREVQLHDELMPLFKRKSMIEYKPSEDDSAARMYGLPNNREAERRHSQMQPLDLSSDGPAVSGYHFDELLRGE